MQVHNSVTHFNMPPLMFNSIQMTTWYRALYALNQISGVDENSIFPLSVWRRYGLNLIQAYRSSKICKPVEGEVEHAALSRYRSFTLGTLHNLMTQDRRDTKPTR